MSSNGTLEQRIADALANNAIASVDLERLGQEVDQAIVEAETAVSEADAGVRSDGD